MQSVWPTATASPSSTKGAAPGSGRLGQRLRVRAEEGQEEELLLARREPAGVVAERFQVGALLRRRSVGDQLDGTPDGRVDRRGGGAVAALDQRAELVDDGL